MKNRTKITSSSIFHPVVLLGMLLFSSVSFIGNPNTRQYTPHTSDKRAITNVSGTETKEQYFFNARKNAASNSIDYSSMLSINEQVKGMYKTHRATGAINMNWNMLGPANTGGETRAVLIDKNDHTGQTVFAGGVSGGLWKSINGGNTWDSVALNLSNDCVSCIAQDSNGNIFIGTGEGFSMYLGGEGFSTELLGGGIFESTDDGKTFNILPATKPIVSNNVGVAWAFTSRIAILPNNPQVIYAATNRGLMVSINGGTSFNYATNSSGIKLNANSLDVKASGDGALVMACINGTAYYTYTASSLTKFTQVNYTGYGALPSSPGGRIELAIAPSNSNYAYASVIGAGSNLIGIYMTTSAVDSGYGGNWHQILSGDSAAFYNGQGFYDNAIGVFPNNPGKAIFGGVTLWSWTQNSSTDTVGVWASLTTYYGYPGDPHYVHPDDHVIVFDKANPNTLYIGCDGGVYKSTDGAKTFQQADRNYDVTQFYSIAFSPDVNANGEGVIGGSQDNGNIYLNGSSFYYEDGIQLTSGDGGQCAISSLNPNVYYVTTNFNSLLHSPNLGGLGTPTNAYNRIKGLNKGANIDSVSRQGSGCFVTPLALFENPYDTTTLDSLLWIAGKSYNPGDTIYPVSPNGNISFPYIINKSIVTGDQLKLQDRVISKIATAFSPNNGVWIMMQAADFIDNAIWMPVGGPQSQPDAFTGTDPVHCLAWSPNGDALFAGTEAGQLFRFSNLDSIIDTSFITGGIFSMANGVKTPVANPLTRVRSKSLTSAIGAGGRDILSISVDPKNGNNLLVSLGGYGYPINIYYSNNALSSAPTFQPAQGNLPAMPIYGSVIDIINSTYPKGSILATEHGVYTTTDVSVPSPSWSINNNGTGNTIVLAIKQQTLQPWNCNNSGKVYIATDGRGLYVDSTFYTPMAIEPIAASTLNVNVRIYPNPMNAGGTIEFILPDNEKTSITIYNIEGRVIKELPIGSETPGLHRIKLNTIDMQTGIYLATVTGTNFRQTSRFVVSR